MLRKFTNALYRAYRKICPLEYLSRPPVYLDTHQLCQKNQNVFTASHGGNIGDVIFGCLFLKALWEQTGKKTSLYLHINIPADYTVNHPLKNIRMNELMAEQLTPLLNMQPYIEKAVICSALPQAIDITLDIFRELPIDLRCGLIQGWYQYCTDLWLNIFDPWISAHKNPRYANKIVISRTARLRSQHIDYSFLKTYSNRLVFIGLPEECQRFKSETGIHCRMETVQSFDILASILHSCQLFIGNQGFPYTLAESLKCPRVLESNSLAPNNYPLSPNGRIALFQNQFEKFVLNFLEE